MTTPYILVVDDEPDIRSLLQEILEEEGYEVAVAEDGEAARRCRRARRPDLVLLDIWMPDVDGITLLREWSDEHGLDCPVIIMSGHGTVETAVEATRLGAYDFIEKPLSLAKLLVTVERALETDKLYRENAGLRRRVQPLAEPLGKSAVMQQVREQIKRIAQHDTSVLISGEPGTGKELMARYLHANSARRERPFLDVGVAAIAAENATVELFGREDGDKVHFGLLEQANGGTLFLDDIGDMDLSTQGKLVGALESKSFQRLGGSQRVQLNVRTIAATHYDLERLVQDGRFRSDLYYHLNVVPVTIPPLREHREDIPEFLSYYLNMFVNQERLPYRGFTLAAQNRLRNYGWPGNVRELKNLVQRLLIVGGAPEIGVDEVEAALSAPSAQAAVTAPPLGFDLPLREARENFEKAYLEYQLRQAGGSVGKVAQAAKIERTHLYRKLRSLGIDARQIKEQEQ